MVKRRWVRWTIGVGLAAGCLTLGALVVIVSSGPCSQVTKANFTKIKAGLTEGQVQAVLGGPPGDYRVGNGPGLVLEDLYGGGMLMQDDGWQEWWGDEGVIQVVFDPRGLCCGAGLRGQAPSHLSLTASASGSAGDQYFPRLVNAARTPVPAEGRPRL